MTKEDFLIRAREHHGYKYQYPSLTDKILTTDDIELIYDNVLYKQKVSKHIMGRCPEKNTPRKTTEQFIAESKKVWGDKYDYSLVEYTGALKKVKIIYNGIVYEQDAVSHISGDAPEFRMNQHSFIHKAKEIHGDRYDYQYVKYKMGDIPVMIGYKGVFYLQKPYHHLSGSRPENISLSVRKSIGKFIKDANNVHDFKYNYDKSVYIRNQIKLIITCPIHGDFEQTPNSHLNGNGCPSCNESNGEKEISKYLNKMNINFIRQKKFDDCKNIYPLPFDFYIASARTLIEFDGKQHFEPCEHFGGIEAYNNLKINDKIKNDYCEENYINLIRIRYDQIDMIPEILYEGLKVFIK